MLVEEGRMAEGKYRAIFEAASAGGENDGDMYLQEPGVEGVFVLFGGIEIVAIRRSFGSVIRFLWSAIHVECRALICI